MNAHPQSWKMAAVAAAILSLAGIAAARPQAASKPQQTETTADAARKAREQKNAAGKSGRVWDNDNISLPAGDLEVIGPDANAPAPDTSAATGDQAAANGATANAAAPALSPEELAQAQQAVKDAQEKIEDLKKDVDLTQRKYNLDAAVFYGKPDFVEDKDGQKTITEEKAGVDEMKRQLQAAQQALAELQAKLGPAAAAKPSEAKPAAQPKPPQQAANPIVPDTNAPPAQAPDSNSKPADTKPADTNPPDNKPPDTQAPQPKPQQPPPVHDS